MNPPILLEREPELRRRIESAKDSTALERVHEDLSAMLEKNPDQEQQSAYMRLIGILAAKVQEMCEQKTDTSGKLEVLRLRLKTVKSALEVFNLVGDGGVQPDKPYSFDASGRGPTIRVDIAKFIEQAFLLNPRSLELRAFQSPDKSKISADFTLHRSTSGSPRLYFSTKNEILNKLLQFTKTDIFNSAAGIPLAPGTVIDSFCIRASDGALVLNQGAQDQRVLLRTDDVLGLFPGVKEKMKPQQRVAAEAEAADTVLPAPEKMPPTETKETKEQQETKEKREPVSVPKREYEVVQHEEMPKGRMQKALEWFKDLPGAAQLAIGGGVAILATSSLSAASNIPFLGKLVVPAAAIGGIAWWGKNGFHIPEWLKNIFSGKEKKIYATYAEAINERAVEVGSAVPGALLTAKVIAAVKDERVDSLSTASAKRFLQAQVVTMLPEWLQGILGGLPSGFAEQVTRLQWYCDRFCQGNPQCGEEIIQPGDTVAQALSKLSVRGFPKPTPSATAIQERKSLTETQEKATAATAAMSAGNATPEQKKFHHRTLEERDQLLRGLEALERGDRMPDILGKIENWWNGLSPQDKLIMGWTQTNFDTLRKVVADGNKEVFHAQVRELRGLIERGKKETPKQNPGLHAKIDQEFTSFEETMDDVNIQKTPDPSWPEILWSIVCNIRNSTVRYSIGAGGLVTVSWIAGRMLPGGLGKALQYPALLATDVALGVTRPAYNPMYGYRLLRYPNAIDVSRAIDQHYWSLVAAGRTEKEIAEEMGRRWAYLGTRAQRWIPFAQTAEMKRVRDLDKPVRVIGNTVERRNMADRVNQIRKWKAGTDAKPHVFRMPDWATTAKLTERETAQIMLMRNKEDIIALLGGADESARTALRAQLKTAEGVAALEKVRTAEQLKVSGTTTADVSVVGDAADATSAASRAGRSAAGAAEDVAGVADDAVRARPAALAAGAARSGYRETIAGGIAEELGLDPERYAHRQFAEWIDTHPQSARIRELIGTASPEYKAALRGNVAIRQKLRVLIEGCGDDIGALESKIAAHVRKIHPEKIFELSERYATVKQALGLGTNPANEKIDTMIQRIVKSEHYDDLIEYFYARRISLSTIAAHPDRIDSAIAEINSAAVSGGGAAADTVRVAHAAATIEAVDSSKPRLRLYTGSDGADDVAEAAAPRHTSAVPHTSTAIPDHGGPAPRLEPHPLPEAKTFPRLSPETIVPDAAAATTRLEPAVVASAAGALDGADEAVRAAAESAPGRHGLAEFILKQERNLPVATKLTNAEKVRIEAVHAYKAKELEELPILSRERKLILIEKMDMLQEGGLFTHQEAGKLVRSGVCGFDDIAKHAQYLRAAGKSAEAKALLTAHAQKIFSGVNGGDKLLKLRSVQYLMEMDNAEEALGLVADIARTGTAEQAKNAAKYLVTLGNNAPEALRAREVVQLVAGGKSGNPAAIARFFRAVPTTGAGAVTAESCVKAIEGMTTWQRAGYGARTLYGFGVAAGVGGAAWDAYQIKEGVGKEFDWMEKIGNDLLKAGLRPSPGDPYTYTHAESGAVVSLKKIDPTDIESASASYAIDAGGVAVSVLAPSFMLGPGGLLVGGVIIAAHFAKGKFMDAIEQRKRTDFLASGTTPAWLIAMLGTESLLRKSEYDIVREHAGLMLSEVVPTTLGDAALTMNPFGLAAREGYRAGNREEREKLKEGVRTKVSIGSMYRQFAQSYPELIAELPNAENGPRSFLDPDGQFLKPDGDFQRIVQKYIALSIHARTAGEGVKFSRSASFDVSENVGGFGTWMVAGSIPVVNKWNYNDAFEEGMCFYIHHLREKRWRAAEEGIPEKVEAERIRMQKDSPWYTAADLEDHLRSYREALQETLRSEAEQSKESSYVFNTAPWNLPKSTDGKTVAERLIDERTAEVERASDETSAKRAGEGYEIPGVTNGKLSIEQFTREHVRPFHSEGVRGRLEKQDPKTPFSFRQLEDMGSSNDEFIGKLTETLKPIGEAVAAFRTPHRSDTELRETVAANLPRITFALQWAAHYGYLSDYLRHWRNISNPVLPDVPSTFFDLLAKWSHAGYPALIDEKEFQMMQQSAKQRAEAPRTVPGFSSFPPHPKIRSGGQDGNVPVAGTLPGFASGKGTARLFGMEGYLAECQRGLDAQRTQGGEAEDILLGATGDPLAVLLRNSPWKSGHGSQERLSFPFSPSLMGRKSTPFSHPAPSEGATGDAYIDRNGFPRPLTEVIHQRDTIALTAEEFASYLAHLRKNPALAEVSKRFAAESPEDAKESRRVVQTGSIFFPLQQYLLSNRIFVVMDLPEESRPGVRIAA